MAFENLVCIVGNYLRNGWKNVVITDLKDFEKIAFSGSFYFNTDDIDALWEKLKDKAKVCYGIENFPYGMREFAIYDNNGYLLQFGQEVGRELN